MPRAVDQSNKEYQKANRRRGQHGSAKILKLRMQRLRQMGKQRRPDDVAAKPAADDRGGAPAVNPTADANPTADVLDNDEIVPAALQASQEPSAEPPIPLSTTTAPSSVATPSTSRKQPKHPSGYHTPRPPRRPAREEAVRAAKRLRSTSAESPDGVAAAAPEVVMPPEDNPPPSSSYSCISLEEIIIHLLYVKINFVGSSSFIIRLIHIFLTHSYLHKIYHLKRSTL